MDIFVRTIHNEELSVELTANDTQETFEVKIDQVLGYPHTSPVPNIQSLVCGDVIDMSDIPHKVLTHCLCPDIDVTIFPNTTFRDLKIIEKTIQHHGTLDVTLTNRELDSIKEIEELNIYYWNKGYIKDESLTVCNDIDLVWHLVSTGDLISSSHLDSSYIAIFSKNNSANVSSNDNLFVIGSGNVSPNENLFTMGVPRPSIAICTHKPNHMFSHSIVLNGSASKLQSQGIGTTAIAPIRCIPEGDHPLPTGLPLGVLLRSMLTLPLIPSYMKNTNVSKSLFYLYLI